jgi:Fungal specific transcription factor domain
MASGEDIFAVMQACVLLSWYFYSEGRWVEIWVFAGFQTRTAIPLRLNYPGTFARQNGNSPGAYLAAPKDALELELRRRTWWMAVLFDRIVSVGGWVHSIDERDIGTELPLRSQDFENNVSECVKIEASIRLIVFVAIHARQSAESVNPRRLHLSSSRVHGLIPAAHQGHDVIR